MNSGEPIVFFGNERIATGVQTTVPTLRGLLERGYNVKAVVSNYEQGTSRSARTLEIQAVAEQHNIPVLLPSKPAEIIEQLRSYNAQIAVLVAYGRIVPQSVIDIFAKGIVNIHPSLLPLHRGPTPLESVILNGDTMTGVSVMNLAKEMDAGPIFGQSEISLTGTESKQTLADQLLELGSKMILELLPGILSGTVVALPQDNTRATYDRLLTKSDGFIEWNKPANILEREIRAYSEWPKSYTTLQDKEVIVTAAHPIDISGSPGSIALHVKELIVYCGQGALVLDRLKPAGKREMTGKEFIAGHKPIV